jgi:hypothetical protein
MVNRFGSVYLFDQATQQLRDAANPLQQPSPVRVTEYNVSPLVEREVKVIQNGQDTSILQEGDYAVAQGLEHGWNKATYTIPAAQFEQEGSYEVRLWTKDQVGNVSQNDQAPEGSDDAPLIDCTGAQWGNLIENCGDGAAVAFRIDKTPPAITVADLAQGGEYRVAQLPVEFQVTDFFEDNIESVGVAVDGVDVEVAAAGQDSYEVTVPSAFSPQTVVFTARDKSGRESSRQIGDVLVTNNRWAIWFNNTPLFIGTVVGAVALLGGLFWLIVAWRRRRGRSEAGAPA